MKKTKNNWWIIVVAFVIGLLIGYFLLTNLNLFGKEVSMSPTTKCLKRFSKCVGSCDHMSTDNYFKCLGVCQGKYEHCMGIIPGIIQTETVSTSNTGISSTG